MKCLSPLCFVPLCTFTPSSSWGDPFVQGLLVYSKIVAQEKLVQSPSRPLHSVEMPQTVKSTRHFTRHNGGPLHHGNHHLHRLRLRRQIVLY